MSNYPTHALTVVHGCTSLIQKSSASKACRQAVKNLSVFELALPPSRRSGAALAGNARSLATTLAGGMAGPAPYRARRTREAPAPHSQQGCMQQRVCHCPSCCMSKQHPCHRLPSNGETWVGLGRETRTAQSMPDSAPARPTGGRSSSSAVSSAAISPGPAEAASAASTRLQGMTGSLARHAA